MRTMDEINDGRTPPQRVDLKVGQWLDRRYYVADVSGGWATLLMQTIDHSRAEIQEIGERIREENEKQRVNRRRRKRKCVDKPGKPQDNSGV